MDNTQKFEALCREVKECRAKDRALFAEVEKKRLEMEAVKVPWKQANEDLTLAVKNLDAFVSHWKNEETRPEKN